MGSSEHAVSRRLRRKVEDDGVRVEQVLLGVVGVGIVGADEARDQLVDCDLSPADGPPDPLQVDIRGFDLEGLDLFRSITITSIIRKRNSKR